MIVVRAATAADAAAIAAVHVQSHRETYSARFGAGYTGPSPDERLALWTVVLPAGGAYVAVDGAAVVGFGHAHGARITTLYILASHHRRGIGRRLMALLLDHLRRAGVAEARFEVLEGNAGAIGFYEAQGARLVGRQPVPEDPGGRHEELIYAIATLRPRDRS